MSGDPMRLLLADDEPLALRRMRLALQSVADIEIVGVATDGAQAIAAMRDLRPDVALLDIRMPLMDGFEVVNAAGDAGAPAIIFVSAFDSYAVRAFAAAAVDYLVKPVEFERLARAIERARAVRRAQDAGQRVEELASVVDALRREMRDYVRLHWEGRTLLHRETMAHLERKLDPEIMLRVHRSAFINWGRLKAVRRDANGRLLAVLADGQEVPVSRAYAQRVIAEMRLRSVG
jgi:DNA-binding LytR/AlgR family response regulator